MDKRIGAQFYTIREFCKTMEDFEASCKKVRDIGYKIVQLSGIGDFSGEEVKTILDRYDLQAVCTHRSAGNYLDTPEKEIAYHKAIGCKIAGIGALPCNEQKMEAAEAFIQKFQPIIQTLGAQGITFAYHNHMFEFEKVDGRYIFDTILENMEGMKLILDVYWLAFSGIDPAKFIRMHKGQIACVHFKDLKIVGRTPAFAEVGQGNLDWDNVIEACEAADVQYALVEQDTCDGDPFKSLKISYDFLCKKGFC